MPFCSAAICLCGLADSAAVTLLQPGTLPQGAVDMLACTDVCDAEPRTGQKNSLCIATPEREVFIRADSREIINGSAQRRRRWSVLPAAASHLSLSMLQVERAAVRLCADQQTEPQEETQG